MNDNVFDTYFEGFGEFDDEIMPDNVIDNIFEGFNEFNADLTLDNVDPELLIATHTGETVA